MALRMDAHQLDKLLVDYSGSSPAVALAPLTNARTIRAPTQEKFEIYNDTYGYYRDCRPVKRPSPIFEIDEDQNPNEPEDISEYLLLKYGNSPDGIFDLDHCDPVKARSRATPSTSLGVITRLMDTPDRNSFGDSSFRSDETWDLSWDALDQRYNDSVGRSIDMGMGVTPPKLALCRRRLSFCSRIPGVTVPKSLLDEFEAEEKLVKAFKCRHSQIVIGTPIKPPHMRCASVGSYETSSPCANDHHQYDQECDIIDNNKSGYVTEAVLDDERCWKEGSDGKLSNLQEWSFPTGDDPVTGDKYDTTNNIAFVEIV